MKKMTAAKLVICVLCSLLIATLESCPDSQFPCSSERSECIDGVQFCDGVPDCPNGSDETFCPCPQMLQMKCDPSKAPSSENCVDVNMICNNQMDCPMGDSYPCGSCPNNMYECPLEGVCVNVTANCNGIEDCPITGYDESSFICGCPNATQLPFQCGPLSWLCLDTTQFCDGVNHCVESGRDEAFEFCSVSTNGIILGVVVGVTAAVVLVSLLISIVLIFMKKSHRLSKLESAETNGNTVATNEEVKL